MPLLSDHSTPAGLSTNSAKARMILTESSSPILGSETNSMNFSHSTR